MNFGNLKDRAQIAARRVADSDAAHRLSDGAQIAKQLAADQFTKVGPHLRELIVMDEDHALTPEALLLRVVSAVHGDEEAELSLQDVRDTGKRSERLAAAAGIIGGGPGCFLAGLYADAALYCLLADCFDLDLPDAHIAAHLLVAWNVIPDSATAHAVMDPDDPTTIAGEARARFRDATTPRTKRESLRMLWRLRSGATRLPAFEPSTFRTLFFAGRALQERLDTAAAQLGLPADSVKKPGLFRRRRAARTIPASTNPGGQASRVHVAR